MRFSALGVQVTMGCVLGAVSLSASAGPSIDEAVSGAVTYIEKHDCQFDPTDFQAVEDMAGAIGMTSLMQRDMLLDYLKERGLLKAQDGKKPLRLQTTTCGGKEKVALPSQRLAKVLATSESCDLTPQQMQKMASAQGVDTWELSGALRILAREKKVELQRDPRIAHLHLGRCQQ